MPYSTPPLNATGQITTSAVAGATQTTDVILSPGGTGALRIVRIQVNMFRNMTGFLSVVVGFGALTGFWRTTLSMVAGSLVPQWETIFEAPGIQDQTGNHPLRLSDSSNLASQIYLYSIDYYIDDIS